MPVVRTSQSDPLQIAAVGIRDGPGTIGLTFCPGKKHHGQYSGLWDRDLSVDLEAVHRFGAKALVTLMENEELDAVKVPVQQLRSQAIELGLEWHHLPIRDIGVPDERFEDLWTYSGFRLRSTLARGGKVVIHCRGGLGRTGTVAGRLLVEFGDPPERAIQKVRTARPKSIETRTQEDYVRSCRPLFFARVLRSPAERALACLIGGAVGDALGYEVEFKSLSAIQERFGPGGIKAPVIHDGHLIVSDDTQMTLFTLEGLLRSLNDNGSQEQSGITSIRNAYLDWLGTQQHASTLDTKKPFGWLASQKEMRVSRDPGTTCLNALGLGGNGTIGRPINDSKGCGGVMRIAPVALLANFQEVDLVFGAATEVAALTHGHPSGYLSAGLLAAILKLLLQGTCLTNAIDRCCGILRSCRDHEETLAAVDQARRLAAKNSGDHPAIVESLGGGWVGEEALAIALYAALSAKSFVESISIAANHSGDSDSTAAIAGQIWGAAAGMGGVPNDWISRLDVFYPLLHLARQFVSKNL
jgi:ADP-ribosyl-[dinitrogen reductase] hydrolase